MQERRVSTRITVERRSKLLQQSNQAVKHALSDTTNDERISKKLRIETTKSKLEGISTQKILEAQVSKSKRIKSDLSDGTRTKYSHVKAKVNSKPVLSNSTIINTSRSKQRVDPAARDQNILTIRTKIAGGTENLIEIDSALRQDKMNNIKAATYSRAQKVIEVVGAGKLQSQNSLLYIKNDSGIDISLENIPGSLVTAHLGNSIGSHKFKDSVILNAFRHSPEIVHRPLRSRSPLPYFDPLLVEEYEDEIYNSMHEMEVSNSNQLQTMPVANYIINQPEIEWSMRIQLVSWLVEVHFQFKLLPETLFLAVNLIDRTLSARPISLSKLQLVGVAALLIASKYEEIMSPSVSDLEYITDHAYRQDEILRAERYMLGIVKYQIGYVNPLNFLRKVLKTKQDRRIEQLSCYLLEIIMLGPQFLKYLPSHSAAAVLFLSIKSIYDGDWTTELSIMTGFEEVQLLGCVYELLEYLKNPDIRVIYDKYALSCHGNISVSMLEFLKYKGLA